MESSLDSLMSVSSESGPRIFPFFDLPAEIRLKIYELVLVQPSTTVDLDPDNYRLIKPRLTCFLVCRRMHHEAYHIFYGASQQPLRLFPMHGRFFHTKKPLLARIGPQYRAAVNSIELRLGPGWSKPPRCWHTRPEQGLEDCRSLRTLKIFIECDPSNDFFDGFRGIGNDQYTYQVFCLGLLRGIFAQVSSLEVVELDAYVPAVSKNGPLVKALMAAISDAGKKVAWGTISGWREEADAGGLDGLENALAAMAV